VKNLLDSFVEDGNLKEKVMDLMGIAGIAIIWGTAYFFEKWEGFLFWTLMLTGGALGYLSSYGGLAKKFGYKPFTNDPLGWRTAKESYKENEEEEVLNQLEDASAEDSKK
jgi:hypothetical protein